MSLSWLSCVSGQSADQGRQQQQHQKAASQKSTSASSAEPYAPGRQHIPPPVPVPTRGRRARARDVKEDSGCYTTSDSPKSAPNQPAPGLQARRSLQEDSGIYSGDMSAPSSHPQPPPPPLQPQHHHQSYASSMGSNLYSMAYSPCVPKLPNRQAPVNSKNDELRRLVKAKQLEMAMEEQQLCPHGK